MLLFATEPAGSLDVIGVEKNRFVHLSTQSPFVPWGFNYDHDESGRLIEDYWDREWEKVEADFREMKSLGANVVRIHLQLGKVMDGPNEPRLSTLDRLSQLLKLAESVGLYLDITGLGCYHRKDVPEWYDALSEEDRWKTQSLFWEAIASRGANSPAVFCYDLMNEPVSPSGRREKNDWLGPPFAGKHFVQFISLDAAGRSRESIARAWTHQLVTAIRRHDKQHLITVGLVPWSLNRPNVLYSGFAPEQISPEVDFLSLHIYPKMGKVNDALDTLHAFAVGKPVLIEETFPLNCSMTEFADFMVRSREHAAGWIGFYWGKSPEELRQSTGIPEMMTLGWLDFFVRGKPGS